MHQLLWLKASRQHWMFEPISVRTGGAPFRMDDANLMKAVVNLDTGLLVSYIKGLI